MRRVQLRLAMANVDDSTMHALWNVVRTAPSPPRWTHFYLSLKHGILGDRGAWCVAEVMRRAVALEFLHLNLSYVPMGRAGHRALLAIPRSTCLRSCVIKLDSDMLDAADDERGPVQGFFFAEAEKKTTLPWSSRRPTWSICVCHWPSRRSWGSTVCSWGHDCGGCPWTWRGVS